MATMQAKKSQPIGFDRLLDRAERRIAAIKQFVVFAAFDRIVRRTPVDTGRARASWNIGVGEIDQTVPPAGEYESAPNVAEKLGSLNLMDVPLGTPVYVTSSLVYVPRLENGWSKQAANGMVAITAQEIRAEISGQVQKLASGGADG